jgi:hypothetical protein
MSNFFKRILHGLAFGMKSANDEILTQKASSNSDTIGIHQVINEEKLSDALLKGEVTQEVEELRHRTYEVAKESKNFTYIGEGEVVKHKKCKIHNNKFSQPNKLICEDVLHELKNIEKYGNERYIVSLKYDDIVRFKLEQYITMIDVDINDDKPFLRLHFTVFPNKYDSKSKAFINELEKIVNFKSPYEIQRNEICSSINNLSFITQKAIGEDDLIKYNFFDLSFSYIEKNSLEYIITYNFSFFTKDNIEDKFFSETMDKKYNNKEKKDLVLNLSNGRNRVCSMCGMPMSVYDGDITEREYGKSLCINCLKEYLLSK